MHYGELEHEENDFNEDSSFLDILNICKTFVDIYSVGISIIDGDGKPLKTDRDVVALIEIHEYCPKIHVYLEVDPRAKPLTFKLPQDQQNLGTFSSFHYYI